MQINECSHYVPRDQPCIRCRMEMSYRRLQVLTKTPGKAASYERIMHENDIKLFRRMLDAGKRTL